MKLEFEMDGKYNCIEIGKINAIYGRNLSGKTKLCNFIADGFNNKNKDLFLVDGMVLHKNQFNFFHINNKFNISDEIKMKSKSMLYKLFYDRYLEDNLDEFNIKLMEFNKCFNIEELNSSIFELNNSLMLSNISYKSGINDFNEISNLLFYLEYNDETSESVIIEMYFKLCIMLQDNQKQTLVIFDDIDKYLDCAVIKNIIEFCDGYDNLTVIFTTKSAETLSLFINHNIYDCSFKKFNYNELVRVAILMYEFDKNGSNISFDNFVIENEMLITAEDIEFYKRELEMYYLIIFNKLIFDVEYSRILDQFVTRFLSII